MNPNIISVKTITLSTVFLAILIIITLIALFSYESYAFETIELKGEKFEANNYSDQVNSGNTVVKKITQANTNGFNCLIKKGYEYPFCHSQYKFADDSFNGMDFSNFEELKIYGTYAAPSKNDFVRISLLNFNPEYSKPNKSYTSKYNIMEIQAKELTFPIVIKLEDLSVPKWWASDMRRENVDTSQEIDNVTYMEIGTGTGASYGMHRLRINKIEFTRNLISLNQVYEYIILVWGIIVTSFVVFVITYLIINLSRSKKNEENLIAINKMLSVKSAELELISMHDELTGLLNRTGLKSKMIECLDKKRFPLTLVMIDVDFFKKINDTYGHQKGDLVLENLGGLLKTFIKEGESVSRFGGEEFIVLMPGKDIEDVLQRLDNLRVQIEQTDMQIDQNVTASFGLASSKQYSEFKKLIESADAALYQAKQDGRNCIRVSV